MHAVEQIIECKCPVPVPTKGETRFKTLSGSLIAKNGVITNRDLVLAGDGFKITGSGILANLHNDTVKYNLTLAVDKQAKQTDGSKYNIGGYDVTINCRGKIESPRCLPDLGKIIKQVVANAAKDKIKKSVGDKLKDVIPGKAGDALKDLFKF